MLDQLKPGSIRPSIALICFSDALTSAALFSSIGAPLDVPWGIGYLYVSGCPTGCPVGHESWWILTDMIYVYSLISVSVSFQVSRLCNPHGCRKFSWLKWLDRVSSLWEFCLGVLACFGWRIWHQRCQMSKKMFISKRFFCCRSWQVATTQGGFVVEFPVQLGFV